MRAIPHSLLRVSLLNGVTTDGFLKMKEMSFSRSDMSNNGAWLVREGWSEVVHDKKIYRAYPEQWLIVKPTDRIQRFACRRLNSQFKLPKLKLELQTY